MLKQILHAALALTCAAASAQAQGAPRAQSLPLAIVMLDKLPIANSRAVVVRRKEMKPQNLVLVTKETLPADLTRAITVLFNSRSRRGDQVSVDLIAPIAANRSTTPSRDHDQAVADLAALRTARPRFIEGVGSRPVVYSHLRAARKR